MQPAFELSEALTPQLHAAFKVWQSERVALHAALGVEDIFPSQMQRAIGCPQTPSGRLHAGCGARQPPVHPPACVHPSRPGEIEHPVRIVDCWQSGPHRRWSAFGRRRGGRFDAVP